jgi:hypothetical protein
MCTRFLDYSSTVLVVLFLSYIRVSVYYCEDAKVSHLVKNGHLRVFVNQNKKTGINAKIAKIGNDKNRPQ